MSGCNPITYHNVPPNVFDCMKKKLEAAGIHVPPGDSGEMSGSGVKAHFEWDGKDNLKITIKEKPFIVSCGYVTGKISNFVHECHGS